jgi:hypothetical protein
MEMPSVPTDGSDFNNWIHGVGLDKEEDPINALTMVMAHLSFEQGNLVKTLTKSVTGLTGRTQTINDLMKYVNSAISKNSGTPPEDGIALIEVNAEAKDGLIALLKAAGVSTAGMVEQNIAEALEAQLVAAGVDGSLTSVEGNPPRIIFAKKNAESANANMRISAENLQSKTQEATLSMQRALNGFDTTTQAISATIEKGEKERKASTENF